MQEASQVLVTGDDATGDQWGGQQVDVAQTGHAESATSQHDALLTGGRLPQRDRTRVRRRNSRRRPVDHPGRRGRRRHPRPVGRPAHARRAGCRRRLDRRPGRDAPLARRRREGRRNGFGRRARPRRARRRADCGPLSWRRRADGRPTRLRRAGRLRARDDRPAGRNGCSAARIERGSRRQPGGCRPGGVAGGPRPVRPRHSGPLAAGDRRPDRDRRLDLERRHRRLGRRRELRGHAAGGRAIARRGRGIRLVRRPHGVLLPAGARAVTRSEPEPAPPTSPFAAESLAPATATAMDDEPALFRGHPRAAASSKRAAHRAPANRAPANAGMAPFGAKHGRPELGSTTTTQFSALHSTQARLDTRPGSYAGAGDAGREPPLPPAGDPPTWISSLAAAASGAGSSGIAAILLAFALVPPLMRRVPEGSVVRRPTDVLAPIDVPV